MFFKAFERKKETGVTVRQVETTIVHLSAAAGKRGGGHQGVSWWGWGGRGVYWGGWGSAGLKGLGEGRESLDSTEAAVDLRLSVAQGSLRQDGGYREAGEGDRLEENTTMEEPELNDSVPSR